MIKNSHNTVYLDANNVSLISYDPENEKVVTYLDLWLKQNLQARDALHVTIMKENNVHKIATFDSDFQKIDWIKTVGV